MYRLSQYRRILKIPVSDHNAFFLWGPRKVGKTTLLRQNFPKAKWYDLLDSTLQTQLQIDPHRLTEEVVAQAFPLVVLDEVQKVPRLLDEVHWCLENTQTCFILCGSSARKLKRGAANLLGGRAWRYQMFPLTTTEIEQPDLHRILNHGLYPQHYHATQPDKFLQGYVLDYLREEIHDEARMRGVDTFNLFLETLASTHGQLINYANIGRQCGVSPGTVRGYFQILEDTLLGFTLPPWTGSTKHRLIETAKFYLCDPGLVRWLKGISKIQSKTEEFGRAFEHFLINEIRAYLAYKEKREKLYFWRTSTQQEVDLIIGSMQVAIEFKAAANVGIYDLKSMIKLKEDQPKLNRLLAVTLDERPRHLSQGIDIIPWQQFCNHLWAGKII